MKFKSYLKRLIGPKHTYILTHFKKSYFPGGFGAKTFSGNGEDIILENYLFKDKRDGFYVDIGCYHPKHISNTYKLYKKGWSSINVDPNEESIKLFNKYRKRDKNLCLGIARHAGQKEYYKFSHAGVNTFDPAHAEIKKSKDWNTLLETQKIACITLAELLEKYVPDGKSIDVEGLDFEVLQSNNWSKYCPRVILVEDRSFQKYFNESEIYTYLAQQGYEFHSYLDMTLVMHKPNQNS